MQVSDAVASTLARLGVTHAFGMMGSTVAPLIERLPAQGIRVVAVRHEQAGAHMADEVTRLTRRPAVSYGHGAPGGLNLTMGVATAYRDSTPILFINGDVDRAQWGREAWQGVDEMVDVMRPITKAAWRLEDPARAAEWTERAVRLAVSGRPGPVYLQVPRDLWQLTCAAPGPGRQLTCAAPLARPAPDPGDLERAAEVLKGARRPVIATGGGVMWSGAEQALAQVAQRLGAPVITSQTSRGALDEAGPLCLGASGFLGNPVASRALSEADAVLAAGNRMSDLQWSYGALWKGPKLVHVDIDTGNLGKYYPAEITACADARLFLEGLADLLPAAGAPTGYLEGLIRARDGWLEEQKRGDGTFGPADVTAAAWAVCPEDTMYAVGAGRHGQFAALIPARVPHGVIKAIGTAPMGYAFPAALAAALIHPERPVVAMVGDGDFLMNVQDLETAAREKLPVISVVFNDFKLSQQADQGFTVGVCHQNPDFRDLAGSFGCFGARATSRQACETALREALEAGVPAVIDARIAG